MCSLAAVGCIGVVLSGTLFRFAIIWIVALQKAAVVEVEKCSLSGLSQLQCVCRFFSTASFEQKSSVLPPHTAAELLGKANLERHAKGDERRA